MIAPVAKGSGLGVRAGRGRAWLLGKGYFDHIRDREGGWGRGKVEVRRRWEE